VNPLASLAAAGMIAGGVVLSARITDATCDARYAGKTSVASAARFASSGVFDTADMRTFPPALRFRLHAKRDGATSTKLEERSRVGMARRSAVREGGTSAPQSAPGQRLPAEPRRQFGAGITAAFEGWFYNEDGSRTFLVGYLNRNTVQELDIPVGPDNRIEPGGPDMGQPTHFLPGRIHGVFTIPVPKAFTPQDKYTWTIVANGQSTSIPLRLNSDYVVNPFSEIAVKNTPPVVRFEQNGPAFQGPIANPSKAVSLAASATAPFALSIWASDDMKYTSGTSAPLTTPRPPVTLTWSKYRGPGAVTFDKAKPAVEKLPATESGGTEPAFSGRATTRVTFSAPGEYLLHVTANDYSGEGGGGFVCCWTTAMVKVAVQP
jgi:hypothetical protein